ncbi:bifunctional 3-(3-hydroxy-phenyl)propionate/3-hydroxycinnamic acid hydroxylase [Luteococcus sp. Sow4_B9]|uniref:bifunctional 3-(3-hydroxy-phenyl)propionate/3-hydroxycinnamic acid hydroxylase n=1 Tax=Luteococcus sp. Sow4_B9 TaxID=3438792 RepID=UPI003F992298
MADLDTDVLIAGAGPCGLALANMLGAQGVRTVLVEARDTLIDYPRGVGLDDESMRTLQGIGLAQQVMPHTVPQHVMRLVNGSGETMVVNDPQGEPFGWPRKFGFNQPLVDKVLAEGLQRHPDVNLRFGHKLTQLTEHEDRVEAEVTLSDGTTSTITAAYHVGCEGGSSFTRKWLGTEFEGRSPSTRWVVIDVRNDPLGIPNVYLGADPARPYVSIGLPHAIRRWEFMLFDDEPTEAVEDDAFIAKLLKDHVPDPANLDVIRRRVFTHHGRIAKTFRRGRVMIAGDAAHLMPVWMGQGWNSGMRDATNLGWKLASVVHGRSTADLLDTYTDERHEHAKAMIDLSMAFGTAIKPTDRKVAFARDVAARALNVAPQVKSYFSDMKFKPMPRYEKGVVVDVDTMESGKASAKRIRGRGFGIPARNVVEKNSPVGLQFIQPRVLVDGEVKLLDDAIGAGWALLAWGNDPLQLLDEKSRALVEENQIRTVQIFSDTQLGWATEHFKGTSSLLLGDTTNALKQWFDKRSVGVVLLRPDRFVAAAGLAQDTPRLVEATLRAAHSTSLEG